MYIASTVSIVPTPFTKNHETTFPKVPPLDTCRPPGIVPNLVDVYAGFLQLVSPRSIELARPAVEKMQKLNSPVRDTGLYLIYLHTCSGHVAQLACQSNRPVNPGSKQSLSSQSKAHSTSRYRIHQRLTGQMKHHSSLAQLRVQNHKGQ